MANDEEAGCESSARSVGSEASTSGSLAPGGSTTPSASATNTGGQSSPSGSPASPSAMTFVRSHVRTATDDADIWQESETTNALTAEPLNGLPAHALISSAAASPAKTSPSPDDGRDSRASGPGCSSSSPGSLSLFDPAGFSSRTYPDCSPRMAVGTSESCLDRWPTSGTAWLGGFSTADSSECPSADGVCSSSQVTLADVLEPNAPARYSLSARAAAGILRRAEKRRRSLPESLARALTDLAAGETKKGA